MGLRMIANAAPKLCCVALLLLVPMLANATQQGTYSSLKYSDESGDLNGYEVEFIPTNRGLKAVVQVAEGEIEGVYVVDVTQSEDGQLKFPVPLATGKSGVFIGRVAGNGLRGAIQLPAGSQRLTLTRSIGYWNRQK